MAFIGIAVNIWRDTFGTGGTGSGRMTGAFIVGRDTNFFVGRDGNNFVTR